MMSQGLSVEALEILVNVTLSSARVLPLFIMLPFLSGSTVTGLFKFPLAALIGYSLWYPPENIYKEFEVVDYLWALCKEVIVGTCIAIILSFPFWVMHAVGSYIDNQRGATISSVLSPQSGIDASELANFFNMLSVALILAAGGILQMLNVLQHSYEIWPPLTDKLPSYTVFFGFLTELISSAIRLSAPVVTVFLICELILGLMGRYTPQLNPFSLALSLKTLIGFGVLFIYFTPVLPEEIVALTDKFHLTR